MDMVRLVLGGRGGRGGGEAAAKVRMLAGESKPLGMRRGRPEDTTARQASASRGGRVHRGEQLERKGEANLPGRGRRQTEASRLRGRHALRRQRRARARRGAGRRGGRPPLRRTRARAGSRPGAAAHRRRWCGKSREPTRTG